MGIALLRDQTMQHTELSDGIAGSFRQFCDTCLRHSKFILILTDFLSLFLLLSSCLYNKTGTYLTGIALLITIWAFIAFFKHTYSQLLSEDAEIIIRRVFYHWLTFAAIAWILYPILFAELFNYKMYLISLLLLGGVIFSVRIFFLLVRKKYKHLLIKKNKIAVIGENIYSRQLLKSIEKESSEYQIEGCYDKNELNLFTGKKGDVSDIYLLSRKGVREIYCCASVLSYKEMMALLKEADRYMIRVRFMPDALPFGNQIRLQNINKVPVFVLRPEPLLSDKHKMIKRAFDICFSLFIIVFFLSWLTPVLWLIIRLETKGPLFFRQERTGIDNKTFYCLKFRTMVAGNRSSDFRQAGKNDPRVTRVGAFLRRTSIDEFPQFFNVLTGDMSVVGPRPHMLFHTNHYRKKIGTYMIRHYVKPGITGLAQVNGYRGSTQKLTAMKLRVEHDIDYIENWTFMLDLKIVFLTIWNLLIRDENAY